MKLAELQARFGQALLYGDETSLTSWLCDDGVSPELLVEIYRNSALASLVSVLSNTFAVVRSLLADEDFRRIAEAFVRAYPPIQPRLDEYGERFAEFLELSDVAAGQAYLANLARLEWVVHRAAHDS